jgi:fumarylacetoacetase
MSQHPNDTDLKSFIDVNRDSHFPIQNLPFGIFSTTTGPSRRAGVAIGDWILDLASLENADLLKIHSTPVFSNATLNEFLGLGRTSWIAARQRISELLRHDNPALRDNKQRPCIYPPPLAASATFFYRKNTPKIVSTSLAA